MWNIRSTSVRRKSRSDLTRVLGFQDSKFLFLAAYAVLCLDITQIMENVEGLDALELREP